MRIRFLFVVLLCSSMAFAQSLEEQFRSFSQNAHQRYSDFRDAANKKYSDFMRQTWDYYKMSAAFTQPEEKMVPPVVYEEPIHAHSVSTQVEVSESIPYTEVEPLPEPASAPEPIAPIEENKQKTVVYTFSYYGTQFTFRYPEHIRIYLTDLGENTLADEWERLSGDAFNNLIRDCILVRDVYQLCDWAYLMMLQQLGETIYGKTNEAVFLQAYIYSQSGYAMRLAKKDQNLYLLIGSKYQLYNVNYFEFDDTYFYAWGATDEDGFYICKGKFDSEQPLDLRIRSEQAFAADMVRVPMRTSKMAISASCVVNSNLIDFYNAYPTGTFGDNIGSRWVAYANAPVEESVRQMLYPTLKDAINGQTEKQAVTRLLNWVQTAFAYKYDDDVWGYDRAFFPSETLYYPYADCEDRSILLSRIVRDLLGLDVILVYYPGHLATAVGFNEDVSGEYLMYNGRKYVVCDPTFVGAPIGKSMPGMDNQQALVIPLSSVL